jgi:hypothetical protein
LEPVILAAYNAIHAAAHAVQAEDQPVGFYFTSDFLSYPQRFIFKESAS